MNIQIKSDLHMEFSQKYSNGIKQSFIADKAIYDECRIHPEADILLLIGDITVANEPNLEYLKDQFKDSKIPILYIPGNHEYYGSSIRETEALLKENLAGSNITYLNKDYFIKDDVMFIGATLWTSLTNPYTQILAKSKQWSCFKHIEGMTLEEWQLLHIDHSSFIKNTLNFELFKDYKKVVMTHFVPTLQHTPEQFKGDLCNPFYSTDLEELMIDENAPKLWVHGHTHDFFDTEIGNTRVVCNPYGYFPRNINFLYDRELVVEV